MALSSPSGHERVQPGVALGRLPSRRHRQAGTKRRTLSHEDHGPYEVLTDKPHHRGSDFAHPRAESFFLLELGQDWLGLHPRDKLTYRHSETK